MVERALTPIEIMVLKRLAAGPKYMRSFQAAKPVVERMISLGHIERCRPDGGTARNMIKLTDAGLHAVVPHV
jgi:hypothetical protein